MIGRRQLMFVGSATVLAACTSTAEVHRTDTTTIAGAAAVTTTMVTTPPGPNSTEPATTSRRDTPVPPPVEVRQEPQGITLADPAFTPLPGANADYGTLGGSVYQIEMPDHWNGQLVLWMHGFEELGPVAHVGPPDFRRYLISNGFAWGASSFSSTLLIPGRAADETAALWDHFVGTYGRPEWSYVSGFSMGGWATHIAAERYGDRFDGALANCGAAGTTPGARISADVFVAAAYVAGVTQAEFDASANVVDLIEHRIRPALADPAKHAEFEQLVVDLTGGARAFGAEGVHLEETTNLQRAGLLIAAGLTPPREEPYRLAAESRVKQDDFNRLAIQFTNNPAAMAEFWAGTEVTGDLQMPLLTMHTTGDGQVPINQAQILRSRVAGAGRDDLLVQRVIADPGHCGFSTGEQEAAFEALTNWVRSGNRPGGTNLDTDDLSSLNHTFELQPRPASGLAEGRAVLSGQARLDGASFDTQWMGAVVHDDRLITPCQLDLPAVVAGRFEITVLGAADSAGCGRPGAEIILWIYVGETKVFATAPVAWPTSGSDDVSVEFATSDPQGAASSIVELNGEVYSSDGRHVAPGTLVEAYIADTVCGKASVRSFGSFAGYILNIVGPDAIPECIGGATVTFHVNGSPARESAINAPPSSNLDLTLPDGTDSP